MLGQIYVRTGISQSMSEPTSISETSSDWSESKLEDSAPELIASSSLMPNSILVTVFPVHADNAGSCAIGCLVIQGG
jgi:hypothetical protein